MANPLKRLAGETLIYGLSSIVARVLNFLLVPLYTYKLTTAQYGTLSNYMAYIAIFQVVLTLGLETGCFRFAMLRLKDDPDTNPDRVFSSALCTVLTVSLLFSAVFLLFNRPISHLFGFTGSLRSLSYFCGILLFDALTAIFFARLRFEHKAFKFAVFKTIKILCELGCNLLFFLTLPTYFARHPRSFLLHFIPALPDYSYILFAIFLSAVVCLILFLPRFLRRGALRIDTGLWTKLMRYSLPLMVAGLPGVLNDMIDRVLFRFCIRPEKFGPWEAQLGIFSACVKLSMLIYLFIQMFRYAAEPFFFGNAKEKDAKTMYAQVLNYFTAFCVTAGLGILFYLDILEHFIGPAFREGIAVVPVMVLAYIVLGIYFNVSTWFKLKDKTSFAIIFTCSALCVTLIINLIFLPRVGYIAAAWGHLISYAVMLLLCIFFGRKYYPIPYNWKRIGFYLLTGTALYGISLLLPLLLQFSQSLKFCVNTLLLLAFVWICLKTEKVKLSLKKNRH